MGVWKKTPEKKEGQGHLLLQQPSAVTKEKCSKPKKRPGVSAKERKRNFYQLFYNNHFVLALSLVIAILIWFIVSYSNVSNRPRMVYDVPITLEMSEAAQEEGLRVFAQSEDTANVSISGNGIVINRITAEDIQVVGTVAPAKSSDGMVTYTITLTAVKKGGGVLSDYEIVKVEPSTITVDVDAYVEKSFSIDSNVKYSVSSTYFANTPILSSENVMVSGPRSVVNKVSTVQAEYDIHDSLTKTATVSAKLMAYDQYGIAVTDENLELSMENVEVTIPIYLRKDLSLTPMLVRTPSGFGKNRLKVSPDSIEVAGPEESLSGMREMSLDPIDLTKIDFDNPVFEASVSLPAGFKNVSNVWTAQVEVDLDGYTQKTFTVSNVSAVNAGENQKVEVLTGAVRVTLAGPEETIASLTADDLYVQADLTGQTSLTGTVELAATVGVTGRTDCWPIGKYTVNAFIE